MIGLLTGALLALSSGQATAPAPLQPSGKWLLEYEDKMCVLSHAYGPPDAPMVLGFRPAPIGTTMDIVLISPGGGADKPTFGKASLQMGAQPKPIDASYLSVKAEKGDQRLTVLSDIDRADFPPPSDAETVTITVDGQPVTFAMHGVPAAMTALDNCQRDLQKQWGIDPAVEASIVKPAQGIESSSWITTDNYPAQAVARHAEGVTRMIWSVGTDGKVSHCTITQSSGSDDLDKAACAAITLHGRYHPALDANKRPVVSWQMRKVIWAMPR